MKLLAISSAIFLSASQVTALAEYYLGNCAGELEAGPIGFPSTDKIFGCFVSNTNDVPCDKVGLNCEEGKNFCDNGFNEFDGVGGRLRIVDCDDHCHKAYDGHEPEPDGTFAAKLVHADTGVAAGTCSSYSYGGASKTCANFGSQVCGVGLYCQEFNG